jgi:hypothetical protein
MSRRAVVRSGDGQAKTVEHLGLIVREFDRDVFEPHRRIDELGDLSGVVGELAVAFDRRVAKSLGVRWLFGVFSAAARAASVAANRVSFKAILSIRLAIGTLVKPQAQPCATIPSRQGLAARVEPVAWGIE